MTKTNTISDFVRVSLQCEERLVTAETAAAEIDYAVSTYAASSSNNTQGGPKKRGTAELAIIRIKICRRA